MSEKFKQDVCIGYNYGTFTAVGIVDCVPSPPGEDVEMQDLQEESKDHHLDSANFAMFQDLLDKEVARGLLKRKLMPKVYKAVSHCQVEGVTAQVTTKAGQKTYQNILYLAP